MPQSRLAPDQERSVVRCAMTKYVILISLDWERPQDGRSSLGTASIAASLKTANIPFDLIEAAVNDHDFDDKAFQQQVMQQIDLRNSEGHECLVGIGAFIWNEPVTQQLTQAIHNSTSAAIVLGGPQISYAKAGDLERLYPFADVFVRGHGEKAMVALATGALPDDLGIHFAGQTDLGKKAEYTLEELPSPYLTGILQPGKKVRWETMRGCPFKCSFCQHRSSTDRYKLKNHQLDFERIVKEARLFAQSGVERISILDPIFHLDVKRTVELLILFNEIGLTAELALQCRFESVKDEFLDALRGLNVVLEFGLQTAIENEGKLIGRPNDLTKAEAVIQKLKARNIRFEVSLIYGLPGQTLASFKKSLSWCWEQGVENIRAWPLMILRGTELDHQREEYGLIESSDEAIPHVVASNSFSHTEYLQMQALADACNPENIQVAHISNKPPKELNHAIFYRA
nr:B12-binding domain-containing radical SAM protein [Oceanobacter mangrovi]